MSQGAAPRKLVPSIHPSIHRSIHPTHRPTPTPQMRDSELMGWRSMSAGLAACLTPRGTGALPLSHPFPVPLLVPRQRRGVQWCVVCLVWDTALLGHPPSKAMDTPVQRCLFHPLSPSSLCTVSDGWMAHAPRQRQAWALRQARPMLQVDDDASNGDLQGRREPRAPPPPSSGGVQASAAHVHGTAKMGALQTPCFSLPPLKECPLV